MMIFKDRQAAGKLLAERLKNTKADLVLGIPRGGVVVASEIAKQLSLPLDVVITRKIGAPFQSELALGAVDPDGEVVGEQGLGVGKELQEIKRRGKLYRQGKKPLNLKNKSVILVDDGLATGLTAASAINYLRRHGAKEIILAVPVASKEALGKIKADKVEVLHVPLFLDAIGRFYQSFEQVSDEEVVELLRNV